MVTVIVLEETLANVAEVQTGDGPTATATLLVVGVVHPAGTWIVDWDPALKSLPLGDVNVNVRVFPVLSAIVVAGVVFTVMVPSPSLAAPASVNVFCACTPDWLP